MDHTTLEIVMVGVGEIVPYAGNAKVHTEKQIDHICNSIRDYGFNDPLGLWHNADGVCEVVYGHGTLQAAKKLGMDRVPCVYLDHMTDEQRREFCHIHNQTQLETGLDYDALTADMDNLGCDWSNYGFEQYCYEPEALFEPEETTEKEPAEPKTCPNCGYVFE